MAVRVVIDFDLGQKFAETWGDRVHRVLNFSDDLGYTFRNSDLATHDIQSNATSRLVVQVRSRAKANRVAAIVEELRFKHFSDGWSKLSIENDR